MTLDGPPAGFYVYSLSDPSDGYVFYIGKGQGSRAWQHQTDAINGRGSNIAKLERIKTILARGEQVVVDIIETYDLESDALEHEFELVDSIPGLLNIMPGGIGRVLSNVEIACRAAVRLKRVAHEQALKKRRKRDQHFQKLKIDRAKLAGSFRGRQDVEEWLNSDMMTSISERRYDARAAQPKRKRSFK